MAENNGGEMYTQWYKVWTEQSKEFFESADKNLKNLFGQPAAVDPSQHLNQINDWMNSLKQQWEFSRLTQEQQAYAEYWKKMLEMSKEASDQMLAEWIKRSKEGKPVQDVHELYELWLKSCHDIYQKSMQTKSYQEAYGEFMNAAMKFWKTSIPK